jgi:hypothetical protein
MRVRVDFSGVFEGESFWVVSIILQQGKDIVPFQYQAFLGHISVQSLSSYIA